ncbi:MAG: response regulator transcription factor [Actinobacteria bacterium]|nr:response regulator transcription factor [Actinomycetota bacterium]
MEATPRILVVEDDRTLRDAIASALRQEGYTVRSTSRSSRAADLAGSFRPDLAVLDIRFPDGPDGFDVARDLRGSSDAPIVFVTAAETLQDRLTGFDVGGDDYLVKPFAMPELLARVRVLLWRTGRASSRSLQLGDLVVDEDARTVVRGGTPVELTPTEFDLLVAFARRPGVVLSKERLLALVWDFASYDGNLVEVYVSTLRRKLEEHGPRVLHTVRGAGYVLRS